MKLQILGSNSKGNCYILKGETESLIIECGVTFNEIKKALDFELKSVVGCLVSHIHLDHSKSIKDVQKAGIPIVTHNHVIDTYQLNHYYELVLELNNIQTIGQFKVMALEVAHDVPTVAFLIQHAECGLVLFATDTSVLNYKIDGLNNVIIEANYCQYILNERIAKGQGNTYVSDRVQRSHLSVQKCMEFLKSNDLTKVNNIVLIHLSDGNSDEQRFKQDIQGAIGHRVHVADKNQTIEFNKTAF